MENGPNMPDWGSQSTTTIGLIQCLQGSQGLGREAFADAVGLMPERVKEWDTGYSEPTLDELVKIADFFWVTVDYLLDRPGTEKDVPAIRKAKEALRTFLDLHPEIPATVDGAGQLIAVVYRFLNTMLPKYYSLENVARQLIVPPEKLESMFAGSVPAPDSVVWLFSRMTGVPATSFGVPSLDVRPKGKVVPLRFGSGDISGPVWPDVPEDG